MSKQNNKANNALQHKRQQQDTKFQPQMKIVFEAFQEQPKTMRMVEVETGIIRSNITWYVDEWRKENRIFEVRKGICPITKFSNVGFFTTNPDLIPKSNQLNLSL